MKISLIQLSDIHLRDTIEKNSVLNKLDSIIRAINSELYQSNRILILVTGDTAFSGKDSEFHIGVDLFNAILGGIKNKNKDIIIIPGNHDCDFSGNDGIREMLRNRMTVEDIYDDTFVKGISTPVLANFYDFADLFKERGQLIYSDLLFEQYRIEDETFAIQVNCINTAWLSVKNEIPGTLLYPINNYKSYLQNKANISITLLHHPTHWLNPNNKREVDLILQANSDIIFTGHEHENTHNKSNNFQGEETLYFEASALQTDKPDESSFTIFHFNIIENTLSKNVFTWNDDRKIYIKNESISNNNINLAKTLKKYDYHFREEFEDWLRDPGLMIKHPRIKDKLLLEDIYIFPDAEKHNFEEKEKEFQSEIINLKSLLSLEDKKVLVIGSENYGKTAFCKQYILNAFDKGLIPVLVNGERFNQTSLSELKKVILSDFIKQYGDTKKDEFSQLEEEQIVLIIDDIHKSPLNAKHRIKLLNEINSHYSNVLITSSEFIKYQELLTETEEATYENEFLFIQMLPLGNLLRGDLVRIWNELGIDQHTPEDHDRKGNR